MFKNYFKIAVRNLKRDKVYSFINIFGLAIGITCCLLILLYINDELSYDNFHEKADRIYRVNTDLKFGANELSIPLCSDMLGPMMKKDYPQIEEYTRIYSFGDIRLIKKGNDYLNERGVIFADSTFFKVFTYPAAYGNTDNILNEPKTVVITESIANKYFGKANVVGNYIETNENGSTKYKIAAVLKNPPKNSHFSFNMIYPMRDLSYDWGNYVSSNMRTYFLLRPGVDYKEVEEKFVEYNDRYAFPYAKKYMNIESRQAFTKAGNRLEHFLMPIRDIHLYSKLSQEFSPTGTIEYVYIFSAIALFILVIACVNFMNLTTARSANRAREVGIRKVLGTDRKTLIVQFLSESTLMAFCSILIALAVVYPVLPLFDRLAGKELHYSNIASSLILPFVTALPFLIGLLAGSYPAFYLSRFNPAHIVKGKLQHSNKGLRLRSMLVVFQFTASIILIIGTLIIFKQLNYIQHKNLGYQKEQVLIINDSYALGNSIEAFKNEILKVPGVVSGTITEFLPIPSARNFSAFFKEASAVSQSGITMQRWKIDNDYLKTLGIKLISGRNFSLDFGSDSSSIILNETAVKHMGYTNPVNEKIYTWVKDDRVKVYNIIGVVKNFHFESFHQDIGPLCFICGKSNGNISYKVNAASITNILQAAKDKWRTMAPAIPFSYKFMDESFDETYRTEQRTGITVLTFSILSILVACLGLFGLAAFLAEQKTKEIGVRKALGASVLSIIVLLSKEFLKWVFIANIIAWPVAYYFMNNWLQDFAYRIDINILIFITAGVIALIIALTTISFQAIKAAIGDPVEALRYE